MNVNTLLCSIKLYTHNLVVSWLPSWSSPMLTNHIRRVLASHNRSAFFAKYPRHRKLISLNKRFSGRSSPEFNLPHDWNSLLDNDDVPPMTARTPERWPPADTLVQYLREYAGRCSHSTV